MCVCVFRSLSFFVRSAIFFHGISCHCHTIAVALFFAQTRRANAFCARTQPKVTLKLLDADELVSARSPVAFNLNLDNSLRFGTPEFPESLKFRGNFNISPKEVDAINGGNCFRNSASLLLGTDESSSLTLGKRSQLQCIPNYYYEDANRRCKTEKMYIRQKNTQLSEKAAERNELKKRIFTNKWHCFRFCAEHSKRQCNYFPYVAVSCHEKKVLKCVPFFFFVFIFVSSFLPFFFCLLLNLWCGSVLGMERNEQKQIFAKQTQHSETVLTILLRAQRRQSGCAGFAYVWLTASRYKHPRNIHFSVALLPSPRHLQQNGRRKNGKKAAKAKTNKNRYMCPFCFSQCLNVMSPCAISHIRATATSMRPHHQPTGKSAADSVLKFSTSTKWPDSGHRIPVICTLMWQGQTGPRRIRGLTIMTFYYSRFKNKFKRIKYFQSLFLHLYLYSFILGALHDISPE